MTYQLHEIRFVVPTEAIVGNYCWICRYYQRPTSLIGVDVRLGSICAIDRDTIAYGSTLELAAGEKYRNPDDSCSRFTELNPVKWSDAGLSEFSSPKDDHVD